MSASTITPTLTYADVSTLHGWANYLKFSPHEEGQSIWAAEDERVRGLVFDLLHPFLAPCLADLLDAEQVSP